MVRLNDGEYRPILRRFRYGEFVVYFNFTYRGLNHGKHCRTYANRAGFIYYVV